MSAGPLDRDALLARWIALCAVAEFLGIGAAAIWYGGMNAAVGEPDAPLARAGAWLLMSLAAVPEGLVLGGLQARGIGWFVPAVSARRFILATIAVGFLGWGIGTFIPMFLAPDMAVDESADPGLLGTIAYAAVFGLAVGAVFGLAQSRAFPPQRHLRMSWIFANALGWAAGLPAIYVGAQLAADVSGWPARIALWCAGGLSAGVLVGIATAGALWLTPPREAAAS